VVIVPLKDKKFIGSLDGINFNEEDHEASKYIFATINQMVIVPLKDRKFIGSLDGINFNEEDHEASKYLFG